ncbi:hypothetical protein bcgnr5390_15790 [Bacillus luti]|nr:hypothetical protein BC2903_45790 [Bacillus cereus]
MNKRKYLIERYGFEKVVVEAMNNREVDVTFFVLNNSIETNDVDENNAYHYQDVVDFILNNNLLIENTEVSFSSKDGLYSISNKTK